MRSPSRLFATCVALACLGAGLAASTAQAASPAWAPIAASGPTNLPPLQSEVQRLLVDAEGGTYTLRHTIATGSGTLSGASIVANLTSGSDTVSGNGIVKSGQPVVGHEVIGPGIPAGTTISAVGSFGTFFNITLSAPAEETVSAASITTGFKQVTGVTTASGAFEAGEAIFGTGIPAGTTIAAVGSGTLTLSALPTTNGSQSLATGQTTAAIPFDASAAELAAELNALPALEVSVIGGPGDKGATSPYFITFDGGGLNNTDVAQISADSGGLSGGFSSLAAASTALQGGAGTAHIGIYPQNVGGAPSSGATTLRFTLNGEFVTSGTPVSSVPSAWSCPGGAGETTMTCTSTREAGPGVALPPLNVPVKSSEAVPSSGVVEIEVWGGGSSSTEAMPATYDMPLIVSAVPAPPGLQAWTAGAYTEEGEIDTRAGAHPYSASTGMLVNTVRAPRGRVVPAGELRDIVADIPPGFLGNPIATEQCPEALEHVDCPHTSMMAFSQIPLGPTNPTDLPFRWGELAAVQNIEAPRGFPAKFRFLTGNLQVLINVVASLRSDEDHGISAGSYNSPQIKPVFGAFFTIWGNPADEGFDGQRCEGFFDNGVPLPESCRTREELLAEGGKDVAFLTNPVDCAEGARRTPKAVLNINTWQDPTFLFAGEVALEPVTECDKLKFDADFEFEPSGAKAADSPAPFSTELAVPGKGQVDKGLLDPDPEARMTPTIRESVVELPKGVVLNASAADGLGACSEQQIGLKGTNFPRPNEIRFNKAPHACPDNSKIGSGEVKSELLADPLKGSLFLAAQGEGNPFGSLFAIYLVIEDPERGINIKLPGEVQVNQADGQQKIVFRDLPPLPFTWLKLNLKGGPRSPLATPTTCGSYRTTATNTPWSAPESGPPHVSGNSFQVDQGPNGTPCANTEAQRPFNIGLAAGSVVPVAGAHSPFQVQLTRADGNQELSSLAIAMPPGFVASLRGIPYCPDAAIAFAHGKAGKAEQAAPSCPAASRVGSTNSAAGSGPSPYYATGALYLSGPYKGAPLSVVAITPAVAGPFDLGNVVVRSALRIDPVTAQITAHTDPLPRIIKGVPLRIRDVRINLDRPAWAQNPTSCEAMAVAVTAYGANGAVSQPASRFQASNCRALAFKPRMNLRLIGGTRRGGHPSLHAVVRPRPGDANIKRAAVTLPRSAFLDQGNIRTICTRVQWAADNCPKAARYGYAKAWTPLLDYPVQGPVYLRSSDNELPDLVADLRGPAHQPLKIEAAFRTDSIRGGIRSTLDAGPDAPVSRFVLRMQGGKRKGLIVNSQNICAGKKRATSRMRAHNGRRESSRPVVHAPNCKKQKRRGAKRGGHKPSKGR